MASDSIVLQQCSCGEILPFKMMTISILVRGLCFNNFDLIGICNQVYGSLFILYLVVDGFINCITFSFMQFISVWYENQTLLETEIFTTN